MTLRVIMRPAYTVRRIRPCGPQTSIGQTRLARFWGTWPACRPDVRPCGNQPFAQRSRLPHPCKQGRGKIRSPSRHLRPKNIFGDQIIGRGGQFGD